MAQLDPQRRPHYPPTERMAILELRATRGWSLEQGTRVFLVTAETVSSWMQRIEEAGAQALVQTGQPVNKFPELVRYLVQRLKVLCPTLGKQKIAQVLCRAGIHLGTTTVGRILKETLHPKPKQPHVSPQSADQETPHETVSDAVVKRVVTAKRCNHVWHVDLTLVPTQLGFWTSWLPFSLPPCWPFGIWLVVAIDHFSRRAMGFAVFHLVEFVQGRHQGAQKCPQPPLLSHEKADELLVRVVGNAVFHGTCSTYCRTAPRRPIGHPLQIHDAFASRRLL